jgi:hypothetical protein
MPPRDSQQGSSGSNGSKNTDGGVQLYDPVNLDVTKVTVDTQVTPEFALADFKSSEVIVRLGFDGTPVRLGPAQGINHPDSVALADLNADGIPDLIVANTNGNNVLVFPGLGNGQFGPELNGGQGFAVGNDPVSVYVNYLDGNAIQAQLIVANAESKSVTILDGQTSNGNWNVTSVNSITTQDLPSKTLLYDVNGDGNPDLLVCNSGSNNVTMYPGLSDGTYASTPAAVIGVGSDPDAMFVGPFDRRLQTDLVTVNAGSDDVTFIADAFGPQPVTQTISSGGITPDAAFAFDPSHTGVLDLVVANSGDGHLAVFRGGNDGLQLAGVITQAGVPAPTGLAPSSWNSDGVDFFAASAGDDAALLLHFDLGIASDFLPVSSSDSASVGQGDEELIAQLMPLGQSSLDLIAVFWGGGSDPDAMSGGSNLREPSTITTLYSPTEGQGDEQPAKLPESSSESPTQPAKPADPSKVDNSQWASFVSGAEIPLNGPHAFDIAIAARDLPEGNLGRPIDGLARLDLAHRADGGPFEVDLDTASGLLDEVIRVHWPEGMARERLAPLDAPQKQDSFPNLDGVDAPAAIENRLETVPLISTALVISTRLILKASPPRPSAFRGKSRPWRFVSLEHDRQAGSTPDLV